MSDATRGAPASERDHDIRRYFLQALVGCAIVSRCYRNIVHQHFLFSLDPCKVRFGCGVATDASATSRRPPRIKIHAHAPHAFLTLTDDVTIACIHNADHADPEGEPVIAERQLVED